MEENVIQINGGIKMNVDISIKNIIYLKMIMSVIRLNVIVKIKNI